MTRWGMVIDTDRCTGCAACVVACHSENNIQTVGEEEAGKGRAMHWFRVERYYEGELVRFGRSFADMGHEEVIPVGWAPHEPLVQIKTERSV